VLAVLAQVLPDARDHHHLRAGRVQPPRGGLGQAHRALDVGYHERPLFTGPARVSRAAGQQRQQAGGGVQQALHRVTRSL
jgi:hypothetical protein